MKQYKCGGCGNDTYLVYKGEKGIITECTKCKSKSIISIQAELKIDWNVDDNNKFYDGCMCIGWE